METEIINGKTAPFYIWGDNCKSFVLLDSTALSIKQELMPPGTKEKLHFHKEAQQFFYILKGEARFFIDGKFITLMDQEGIHVNPSQKHFIENRTELEIEFLVISQPNTNTDRITLKDELDKK